MCFLQFSLQTAIISLNSVNQLIFAMVENCVSFAVRTESFDRRRLKGLITVQLYGEILILRCVLALQRKFSELWIPTLCTFHHNKAFGIQFH
jgi:hypothetical protein